ncbi:MAG: DUF533 domain-containing protein [Pseudorhodobacter sp.]|nr:MAG: DUF533 domain-containing protein [Pseudorhodobacter sp.]
MSLAKTLIKVAIGVAVAKGVSTLVKGGGSGGTASTGGRPRGVEDIMDGIGTRSAGSGHRYDPQAEQGGGGLGDLLGQLTGQSSQPRRRSNAPKGGLEDMLGGGGQSGGLGDLLGQLTGGGSAGRSTAQTGAQSGGGLGDLLGQLTGSMGAQRGAAQGGGLGDLLGAVLGGVGGAAAGGAMAGGSASSRQEDLAAALILRAMVAAVKADGELDADEKRKLTEQLDGASREEIAFINAELEARTDVEDLAAQVPEGMEAQIYVMSLMAIDLDNQREAQHLDRLAKALALDPREVNALHDRAGVQPLYN